MAPGTEETRADEAESELGARLEILATRVEELADEVAALSERSNSRHEQLMGRLSAITGAPWPHTVYHPRGVHDTAEELIDCPECFPPLARALAKRPDKFKQIQEMREASSPVKDLD